MSRICECLVDYNYLGIVNVKVVIFLVQMQRILFLDTAFDAGKSYPINSLSFRFEFSRKVLVLVIGLNLTNICLVSVSILFFLST